MSLLPVFLKLDGRPVLVVGAGEIAAGKIESLVAAKAAVTVVAPQARPEIAQLAQQGVVLWHRREFRKADILGQFVIVAGTNIPEVNQRVYRLARKANILTNAVDDPPHCDFYYGSVVSRGEDLQIAISTNGESPAFAQRLRKEIDALLPLNAASWLHEMGELRREILATQPPGDDRKHLLQRLAHFPVCSSSLCPARLEAQPNREAPTRRTMLAVTAGAALGSLVLLSALLSGHTAISPREARHL